jgi:hypothetical protein
MWDYFVISQKTAESKQSPNGRKFAQSGHPDLDGKQSLAPDK